MEVASRQPCTAGDRGNEKQTQTYLRTTRNDADIPEENLQEPDIQEDDERLKGDAIGDTLYSESWILRTLIKLTQELPNYSRKPDMREDDIPELDETLESDLCFLWDITADHDVANYLFEHDILSIAKSIIEESISPRLTEITIGILANVSCQKDLGSQFLIDQDLITTLVNLLSTNDTETLIQIMRLLDTILQLANNESCLNLLENETFWSCVGFILQNSLNDDLLCGSSKLLDTLARQINPARKYPCENLLVGILECQNQLKSNNCSIDQDPPQAIQEAFRALVSALYNLSRNDEMRAEIVNQSEKVGQFLEFHLANLVRNIRASYDNEDTVQSLTVNAVETVTIYYILIDFPHSFRLLELSGYIGSVLKSFDEESQASKYASDYSEIVGDCFRKQLDMLDIDHCLNGLESLDATALSFVLRAAHRTVPNRLQDLVRVAQTKGTFNKVIETYESCASRGFR